jgi:hypothetical protein
MGFHVAGILDERPFRPILRGVELAANQEKQARPDLCVRIVRKEVRASDVFTRGVRAVPLLIVGLGQLVMRLRKKWVLLNGVAKFDDRLGVLFLGKVSFAPLEILSRGRRGIARAGGNRQDRHRHQGDRDITSRRLRRSCQMHILTYPARIQPGP